MPLFGTRGAASVTGFGGLAKLGYLLRNSLRFRASASATLSRTPASATNRRTWTFSAWVKRGKLTSNNTILNAGYPTVSWFAFIFGSDDTLQIAQTAGSSAGWKTAALFRDPSAWYHVICVVDTTSSTSTMNGSSTDRMRLYVNGVQYVMTSGTIPSQNSDLQVNNTISHTIGGYSSEYYDGEIAEVNFIDGIALTPSSFGKTDPVTGQWIPIKYTGTYGTNGFYLNFTDASAATAAAIGKDSSGNGNNWTPNNISVTAGTTYDSMTDVPTLTSATAANYPVLSPLMGNGATLSNGNLSISGGDDNACTMACPPSGKWYAEFFYTNASNSCHFGIYDNSKSPISLNNSILYVNNGQVYINNSLQTTWASYSSGDTVAIAIDITGNTIYFYKNNTLQGSYNFVSAAGISTSNVIYGVRCNSGVTASVNFGQRPFAYTPPSGFKALNTYNLP